MNFRKFETITRPGHFRLLLLVIFSLVVGACRPVPSPTPFIPTATVTRPEPTPTRPTPPTPEPLSPYENLEAGLAFSLPAGWQVSGPLATVLGHQYLLGPEPLTPGPTTSMIFVSSELTAAEAAQKLQCGGSCPEAIPFEETVIGEQTDQKTMIASPNTVALEWYFVMADGRLIYFTIHDPQTLATRQDILATLQFFPPQITVLAPTATPFPSPTLTPTPVVVERVLAWRRIVLDEAGIEFEAPAGWQESGSGQDWLVDPAGNIGLHFAWQEVGEEWQPNDWLPAPTDLISLNLPWASQSLSYTLSISPTWQSGIIIHVNNFAYHFSTTAPSAEVLEMLRPVLDHTYNTTQLTYTNDIYINDPIECAVNFFHELLFDTSGSQARPYLTAQLRGTLTNNQNPAILLQLNQPFTQYKLTLESAITNTYILIADLTLADNTIIQRRLTVVFQEDNGWHINQITPVE